MVRKLGCVLMILLLLAGCGKGIDEAEQAALEASRLAGMEFFVKQLDCGSAPTVEKREEDGTISLLIGIPAGSKTEKGIDYFTESDKAGMVSAVLAALPSGDEVSN